MAARQSTARVIAVPPCVFGSWSGSDPCGGHWIATVRPPGRTCLDLEKTLGWALEGIFAVDHRPMPVRADRLEEDDRWIDRRPDRLPGRVQGWSVLGGRRLPQDDPRAIREPAVDIREVPRARHRDAADRPLVVVEEDDRAVRERLGPAREPSTVRRPRQVERLPARRERSRERQFGRGKPGTPRPKTPRVGGAGPDQDLVRPWARERDGIALLVG